MMFKFFPSGLYDYDDNPTLDKPINYTNEQLQRIVEELNEYNLYTGHNKTQLLGKIKINYTDGALFCEDPNIQIDNQGLSPSFVGNLIDKGEFYEYDNPKIDHIVLTSTPRSGLVWTSTNNSKGDEKMGLNAEELINKKDNQISDLQEELAITKKQLEDTTKEAKKVKKLEKQLESKQKELEELTTANEEYKSDAEAYREYKQNEKDNIIKELFEDDAEAYENFKDLSLDQLRILKDKQVLDQKQKPSIKANGGGLEGIDEGEPSPVKEEKQIEDLTYEERREIFGEYGL